MVAWRMLGPASDEAGKLLRSLGGEAPVGDKLERAGGGGEGVPGGGEGGGGSADARA